MLNRKTSIFISLLCVLVMCVCGTVVVYAYIKHDIPTTTSVTMTATAVKGSIRGYVDGISGDNASYDYAVQTFDATSTVNNATHTLPAWNPFGETNKALSYSDGTPNNLVIKIVIFNETPSASMKAYCSAITVPTGLTLSADNVKTCVSNATGTTGTPAKLATSGSGDTTYAMTIATGVYQLLQITFTPTSATQSFTGSINFKITMQKA